MSDIYSRFVSYAQVIVKNNVKDWKTHSHITEMLEHESLQVALQYVLRLHNKIDVAEIQYLAALNDRFGGAARQQIGPVISSPSSMRYIAHAYEILAHIASKNLSRVSIVEVGAGYGGLCLVLQAMAKQQFNILIVHYFIYDLPEIQELQKYYTGLHNIDKNIVWCDCNTFGADLHQSDENTGDFVLVSNYCMSEISAKFRKAYLGNLLPRVKAVYMRWNFGSKEDLPSCTSIEPEVPCTYPGNTVVKI